MNGYKGTEAYRSHVDKLQLELLADYLELSRQQSVLLILERPGAFDRYPPSAWYYLGEACRLRNEAGDIERSVKAYQTAIEQSPEFAPSYRALGLYYMKNNNPLQAENYFRQYLELQPDAQDRDYIEYYRTSLKPGE